MQRSIQPLLQTEGKSGQDPGVGSIQSHQTGRQGLSTQLTAVHTYCLLKQLPVTSADADEKDAGDTDLPHIPILNTQRQGSRNDSKL